jgi:hypothetical protein
LGLNISIAYTLPASEPLAFGRCRPDVQIKEWTEVPTADFTTVVVWCAASVLEIVVLVFVLELNLEVVVVLLLLMLFVVIPVFGVVSVFLAVVVGMGAVLVVALSSSSSFPGTGAAGVGVIGGSTVVKGAGKSACRFSISSELISSMMPYRPVLCVVSK